MHDLSLDMWRAAKTAHQKATALFVFQNAHGVRIFGESDPDPELLGLAGPRLADGSWVADGSITAGRDSLQVIGHGGLVLKWGSLRETLVPTESDLLGSLKQSETGAVTLTLNNAAEPFDKQFSLIQATEPLLGAQGKIMLTFPGVPIRDAATRFSGRVTKYVLTSTTCELTLEAV